MWVGTLVLAASALANTETTVFSLKKRAGPNGIPKDTEVRGHVTPEMAWSAPFNDEGKYFAKVCWPASQPADLSVRFNGTFIIVEMDDSSYLPLGEAAHLTEFTLLVSSFRWGIPQDVLAILPYILVALCTGIYLSRVGWP